MSMSEVDEALVEAAALEWFAELGYQIGHALTPDAEAPSAERRGYADTVLVGRLRAAIARLNPTLPAATQEQAISLVLHADGPGLIAQNRSFHNLLVEGARVQFTRANGAIAGDTARLVDFDHPERNDWLVANQITFREGDRERRADIIVYL